MPVVLVTGAGRGLGLGLATRYLEAGWEVIATVRDAPAPAVVALHARYPSRLSIENVDLEDFASIEACARQLRGRTIDVLLGNAAATYPDAGFGRTDYAAWARLMQVNTFAQLKLAEAFAENVAASARRIMFFVSSRVGAAPTPGMIPYRSSKSALNQVVFQLALLLQCRGVCVACGHPCYVKTDATGQRGVFTVEESAHRLFLLIDRLQLTDSGKFFDPDGSELPIVTRQTDPAAAGAAPANIVASTVTQASLR